MSEPIANSNTPSAVCPHCGYTDLDIGEFFVTHDTWNKVECGRCTQPFCCIQHLTVTYSTEPIQATSAPLKLAEP